MPSPSPKRAATQAAELLPSPIAVLLIPQFTSIALSSIIEPLRIANRYISKPYRWVLVSADGEPVPDRNGVKVAVDSALGDVGSIGTLLVVADAQPTRRLERAILPTLRRLARAGATIGGVDTGPLVLARGGLLDGLSATAHWEVLQTFREQFPKVNVTERLFEVGNRRCTCAGGSAALDLVLKDIELRFGSQLALRVSEHCMHGLPRPAGAAQRDLPGGVGARHGRKLARAMQMLEEDGTRLTRMDTVAQTIGVSRRQLQRIFADKLATSPARFRRKVRLDRAHQMLANAEASVTEVAMATGFKSRSYFWRCYRKEFGRSPSSDKR